VQERPKRHKNLNSRFKEDMSRWRETLASSAVGGEREKRIIKRNTAGVLIFCGCEGRNEPGERKEVRGRLVGTGVVFTVKEGRLQAYEVNEKEKDVAERPRKGDAP